MNVNSELSFYNKHSGQLLVNRYRETVRGDSVKSVVLTTDWTVGVRFLTEAKDLSSSPCVQTSSEANPASYPRGIGGKSRPGREADHSPHLLPRSRMSMSYTFSLPWRLHGGSGTVDFFLLFAVGLSIDVSQNSHKIRAIELLKNLVDRIWFPKDIRYVREQCTQKNMERWFSLTGRQKIVLGCSTW
jgi:hypothetical protein